MKLHWFIPLLLLLTFKICHSDQCDIDLDTLINESMYTALICTTNTLLCTFDSIDYKGDDSGIGPKITYTIKTSLIGKINEKEYIEYDGCCPPKLSKGDNVLLFLWKDGWKPHRFPLKYSSYNSDSSISRLKEVCKFLVEDQIDQYFKMSSSKERTLLSNSKLKNCSDSYRTTKGISPKDLMQILNKSKKKSR